MRRTSARSNPFGIVNDVLEQNRIRLEHNLQHTDLSLHLSSVPEDDYSSVEHPRHHPAPSPFASFASFDYASREDQLDPLDNSHFHGWSRTDDGINPYVGDTMSTAAHHASALTLSAGLGGRGARRDISMSGVEFDPERPLGAMIAGADSKLSMFHMDPSKSKTNVSFNPLIVDNTDELDRVLQSGHTRSVRLRSPHSSSSSSASDSDASASSSRPKLSDSLRRVSFSPRRPRSPQPPHHTTSRREPMPTSPLSYSGNISYAAAPTPKPRTKRTDIFPSYGSSANPEVRLQPPTPSSGSQFTRLAKSIARDIGLEARRDSKATPRRNASSDNRSDPRASERNPSQDNKNPGKATASHSRQSIPTPRRSSFKTGRSKATQVQLPDITGLTSAVESPEKPSLHHYPYSGRHSPPRDTEAQLLSTLTAVQSKIAHLENENSISRRRVRELEFELDVCKREVARERSRVQDREDTISRRQHTAEAEAEAGRARKKGKGRESVEVDTDRRYMELVEEKKALESLVTSLRSHLSRLTDELSSHGELLAELRTLRDRDSRALEDKSVEVNRLREEVERLAGEVEVLRGVVEEGLKERRSFRETSVSATGIEPHLEEDEADTSFFPQEEQEDDSGFDEQSTHPDSRLPERTIPTANATLGSSRSRPQVHSEELDQVSAEIEERRSNRSESVGSEAHSAASSPVAGPSPSRAPELAEEGLPASKPIKRRSPRTSLEPETPFPQIRGANLERLFFSAPEHNAKTCTVCHRRRRSGSTNLPQNTFSWLPPRQKTASETRAQNVDDGEDEGFVEGPDVAELAQAPRVRTSKKTSKGKQPQPIGDGDAPESLPPQTVLARVVRELEDDFTHYKSMYCELADQYKVIDAASDITKRHVLAKHLREVVDTLEQKGDQIASLYGLLTFQDKPAHGKHSSTREGQPSDQQHLS